MEVTTMNHITTKTECGCDGNDPCGRVWGLEVGRRNASMVATGTGSEGCQAGPSLASGLWHPSRAAQHLSHVLIR